MPLMDAVQAHRLVIDVLVADAAARYASFGDLLCHLPGVPPDEAASALGRLAALRVIDPEAAARLAPPTQSARTSGDDDVEDSVLPVPHPLDYDWRFSAGTAKWLRSQCVQSSRPGDTVALLGVPTVMSAALMPQGRRWILLEASLATTGALSQLAPGEVVCCDLSRDELPTLDAQVVVADPPWYPEHTRVFVWAAAQLTRPGATILLAQPPVATRPGILAERAGVLAFAQQAGLDPVAIRPGVLAYVSPPFERRALEASGLGQAVPLTWRRGDLIVLHREAVAGGAARPALDASESWREIVLRGARIRFRVDRSTAGEPADPRLLRLIDSDVLASVSRRDPLRQHVSVWTGSNRVFGCWSPGLLAVIADAMKASGCILSAAEAHLRRPATSADQAHIGQAASQLAELAQAETATSPIRPAWADSIVAARDFPADTASNPSPNASTNEEHPAAARSVS
jgi:hypothetical protein